MVGYSGEQTLQLEGVAEELRGDTREERLEVYFAEWPECRSHLRWAGITYFVIRPHWLRFSDYDQKPPSILEFTEADLDQP